MTDIYKDIGKKLAKKGGKALLKILAPYLPVIGLAFLIFMLLAMLIGAVYSAFPDTTGTDRQVGILYGKDVSSRDEKMYEEYNALANKYTVIDTWLVSTEVSRYNENREFRPETRKTYHPGGGVARIRELRDKYGNDYKLRLLWSQIHASCLFRAYSLEENEIKKDVMEKTAVALRPYFYYKMSEVIKCGADG